METKSQSVMCILPLPSDLPVERPETAQSVPAGTLVLTQGAGAWPGRGWTLLQSSTKGWWWQQKEGGAMHMSWVSQEATGPPLPPISPRALPVATHLQ